MSVQKVISTGSSKKKKKKNERKKGERENLWFNITEISWSRVGSRSSKARFKC